MPKKKEGDLPEEGHEDHEIPPDSSTGNLGENFEDFDVMQDYGEEQEASIEALGGLSEDENTFKSLNQARDELENRLMISPAETAMAAAEEGTAGLGNMVGVGIGEKVV